MIEPHPATLMLAEVAALLLVVGLRELAIALLWSALERRLNGSSGGVENRLEPSLSRAA